MSAVERTNGVVLQQIQRVSQRLSADCQLCELADLCLGDTCLEPDLQEFRRGQMIFRRGDRDQCLYSVRRGAVKLARHRVPGEEQVLGFYFPGDVFGFDGLSSARREHEAIALEDCMLCKVPVSELTAGAQVQRFHHTLRLLGDATLAFQEHAALVNRRHASTRLAAFLLDIANRSRCRHSEAISFALPMCRQDIASYLGLTVETVSRRLCDLERDGLIALDERRKAVLIRDLEQLQQLAYY